MACNNQPTGTYVPYIGAQDLSDLVAAIPQLLELHSHLNELLSIPLPTPPATSSVQTLHTGTGHLATGSGALLATGATTP